MCVLCRWNKPVIVYGDDKLRKDHPVVAFLAKEKRCSSLAIFKEGYTPLSTHSLCRSNLSLKRRLL